MNANYELIPEKMMIMNGSVIRVFYNEFEIWRNNVKIAEFCYNRNKSLYKQIKTAMEM